MYTQEYKLIYILIATIVIVGGVIGYFLYSMTRLHRNYLHQHDLQNRAKIVALEKERQLIAADLHDDIGPVLSATMFKLGELDPDKPEEKRLLKEAIEHIDSIFSRMRQLSSMLVPPSLEKRGPLYAIEEFNSIYIREYPLKVIVTPIICPGLSAERALHLYRILQEILHNTIRHSEANRLTISGEIVDNRLIVRTADDGVGFKFNELGEHSGLGLQNLSIRAQMIGAELVTDTKPGKGTRYTIKLSLSEKTN